MTKFHVSIRCGVCCNNKSPIKIIARWFVSNNNPPEGIISSLYIVDTCSVYGADTNLEIYYPPISLLSHFQILSNFNDIGNVYC